MDEAQATASMEPLRQFVTETLRGQWQLSISPSWLSFYNDFVLPTAIVRVFERKKKKEHRTLTHGINSLLDYRSPPRRALYPIQILPLQRAEKPYLTP
jgi:hypothetical protein